MKTEHVDPRKTLLNGTCQNCSIFHLPKYYNYCPKCGNRIAGGNFERFIPEKSECVGFWEKEVTEDGDRLTCSVCHHTRYDFDPYFQLYASNCENCGAEMVSFRKEKERFGFNSAGTKESGEDFRDRIRSLMEMDPER